MPEAREFKVVLQTFRGSRLVAEEAWSHPLGERQARAARAKLARHVVQPLNGCTCLLIVRPC